MKLFGGALECNINEEYIDASKFRQIPDNQEVFVTKNGDGSLIVELLEAINLPLEESIIQHFKVLAEDNESAKSDILEIVQLSQDKIMLRGTQHVKKFGKGDFTELTVFLGLLHVAQFNADILLSINFGTQEDFIAAFQSIQLIDSSIFA